MTPNQPRDSAIASAAFDGTTSVRALGEGEIYAVMPHPPLLPAIFFRAQIIAIITTFIAIFHGTILSMTKGWLSNDPTGFLILAVSVYMVWAERARFKRAVLAGGTIPGSLITVLGCLLFVAGKLSCTSLAQHVSMVVAFMGLVWLMCGNQYMKILCLPFGYLIFMLGLFEELLGRVSIQLQHISAWIASVMLTPMGMPVLLSGRYIEMPHISLEVAGVCSGVHHIVALVALAVPLAWITQRSWLGKVGLVVTGFLMGIFANGLRVALIGLWTFLLPGGPLHGPSEIFYATFISVFGMIVLVFISGITSGIGGKGRGTQAVTVSKDEAMEAGPSRSTSSGVIALGILLVTYAVSSFYTPVPMPLPLPLESFPATIGTWRGQQTTSPPSSYEQMVSDDSLRRTYRDSSGNQIDLYIASFASQEPAKKIIDDRFPLPQQGAESVSISPGNEAVQVRRVAHAEGTGSKILYYWYDVDGRILTDRYRTKFAHVIDAFTKHKTNASLVVVSVDSGTESTVDKAPADVGRQFVETLLPLTRAFLNDV